MIIGTKYIAVPTVFAVLEARKYTCTKCSAQCRGSEQLHQHMMECSDYEKNPPKYIYVWVSRSKSQKLGQSKVGVQTLWFRCQSVVGIYIFDSLYTSSYSTFIMNEHGTCQCCQFHTSNFQYNCCISLRSSKVLSLLQVWWFFFFLKN